MKVINYSLVRILFALIVGLILIIWPDVAVNYLVITVGILFLIPGIISIIGYIASRPRETAGVRFPIEGIGSIFFGLWLIIMPNFFANILMYVLGFILILAGIWQLASLNIARKQMRVPGGFFVVPFLILLMGVIVIFFPADIRNTTFIIIGITCLVYAINEFVNYIKFSRLLPKGKDKDIENIESN